MATPLVIVNIKLFQMMPYILEFMKFHWPTTSRFHTARQKRERLGEGAQCLNRVKSDSWGKYWNVMICST